jgi:hypothetical protein
MHRSVLSSLRWPIALVAMLALLLPAGPALGQTTGTPTARIWIDSPTEGATVRNGAQAYIGGWATDSAGPGSGVDMVRVYLDGPMDGNGTLLGNATYGTARPDVATVFGNPAFANAGYDFVWTPSGLSAGNHTLYVYAHSIANGWSHKTVSLVVPNQPTPPPTGEGPGQYPGPNYWPPYGRPCPAIYPPAPGCPPYYPPSGQVCILIYPPDPACLYPPHTGYPYPPGGYPQPPQHPGPPAPSNVTVIGVTGTTVTLGWSAVPGAVSYRVVQAVGLSDMFVPAATTNPTTTTAVVTGLAPNTSYSFRVAAVDAAGVQSLASFAVSATTTAGP